MAQHTGLKTIVFCLSPKSQFPLPTIQDLLTSSLDPISFVTHTVSYIDISVTPWQENTDILFLDTSEDIDISQLSKQLISFQKRYNGLVISFNSKYSTFCQLNFPIAADISNSFCVSDTQGNIEDLVNVYTVYSGISVVCDNRLLTLLTAEGKEMASKVNVFKQLIHRCGIATISHPIQRADPTAGYLMIEQMAMKDEFLKVIQTSYNSNPFKTNEFRILFLQNITSQCEEPSPTLLPVYTDRTPPNNLFDSKLYFQSLNTDYLGRALIYTEVTTSTLNILNPRFVFSLPDHTSLLVVCSIQTHGKGRGSNQWVSPTGCLMFSQLISIKQNSFLSLRITLLQHIISVALVHGILTIPNYEMLDLKLKWPNDIYYGKDTKLGGVLVNNYSMGSTNKCIISVGMDVNTDNLLSLNSVIDDYNLKNKASLLHLKLESVLARCLNLLEKFLKDIEEGKLPDILQLYYRYWLHANAEISLWDSEDIFLIKSLDEYGYLSVKSKKDGQMYSVQPDGNSFDMLKGCIRKKL